MGWGFRRHEKPDSFHFARAAEERREYNSESL
jgi:hypothetical protein